MSSWEQADEKKSQGFNLSEFSSLGGDSSEAAMRSQLQKLHLQKSDAVPQSQQGIPPPGLQPQQASTTLTNPQFGSINQAQTNVITNNKRQYPPQKAESELTDMDRYGLNGLLGLLRNQNNDQSTTAIGTDLNILGLDMTEHSIDVKLSKTFQSPWIETSRSEVEPQYKLQDFLKIENTPNLSEKLSLFSDETLFYIFYTRTRDVLQELSARALTQRNWRYHKELQVWLTKDSNTEPIQQSPQSERGLYIFFDPHTWEKVRKEFILYYQSIMTPPPQ